MNRSNKLPCTRIRRLFSKTQYRHCHHQIRICRYFLTLALPRRKFIARQLPPTRMFQRLLRLHLWISMLSPRIRPLWRTTRTVYPPPCLLPARMFSHRIFHRVMPQLMGRRIRQGYPLVMLPSQTWRPNQLARMVQRTRMFRPRMGLRCPLHRTVLPQLVRTPVPTLHRLVDSRTSYPLSTEPRLLLPAHTLGTRPCSLCHSTRTFHRTSRPCGVSALEWETLRHRMLLDR